jgi:hypothetical protein
MADPVVNPDDSVWIGQGRGWGFVMAGDDAVWAIFQDDESRHIVRIDPATNERAAVMDALPILPNPIAAVGANGYVWMASWDRSSVTQYDGVTGEQIAEHRVGSHPVEGIYADGNIWTTAIHGNQVTRIDTGTAEVRSLLMDPPGAPNSFAVIRDDLAVVGNARSQPYLIDPQQMEIVGQFDIGTSCRWAAIGGAMWLDFCDERGLLITDVDNGETLGEVEAPVTADPPFYVDDVMWLPKTLNNPFGHGNGRTFVGIDRETHELLAEYEAPTTFTDGYYAIGFDSIWMWGPEGILRIPADTLRDALT